MELLIGNFVTKHKIDENPTRGDPGEVLFAVLGKVSVDLPSLAPVKRFLDVHGGGPEGLEGDDDVSHVELSLQIQLDRDVLPSVAGLRRGLSVERSRE